MPLSHTARVTPKKRAFKPRFFKNRFINRVLNQGLFGQKITGVFRWKKAFFLLAAAFFRHCSFYHFGSIFGPNLAFISGFCKSSGICAREKLLCVWCFVRGKKGFEVLKSTVVTLGTFSLLHVFIFGSGFFV